MMSSIWKFFMSERKESAATGPVPKKTIEIGVLFMGLFYYKTRV